MASSVPRAVPDRESHLANLINFAVFPITAYRRRFVVVHPKRPHLFGIENIAVVHHSQCGATSFTADGIIAAFRDEQHSDIAGAFPRHSLCIADYEQSLRDDVALIRRQPGTPKSASILGFFYEIDSGELTLVASDPGTSASK